MAILFPDGCGHLYVLAQRQLFICSEVSVPERVAIAMIFTDLTRRLDVRSISNAIYGWSSLQNPEL